MALVLVQGSLSGWQPVDDASISFRYAENLAQGHGLVFNPGEQVEGYSNFLWTIMLALCSWMGFDTCHGGMILSIFFSCLSIFLTWKLSKWISGERHWPEWVSYIPPLLTACYPGFSYWGFSAMEPPLLACLVTAFLYLGCEASHSFYKLILAGIIGIMAALTRWETVILWPVIIVFLLSNSPRERAGNILNPLILSFILLAGFGLYFSWRVDFYGDIMPNTYYAKASGSFLLRIPRGLVYTGEMAVCWWVPVSIIAWISGGLKKKSAVLLSSLILYILYVTWTGGDHFAWLRFYIPVLPVAAIMAAELINNLSSFAGKTRFPRLATTFIVIGMLAVFTGTSMRIDYLSARKHHQFVSWWEHVGQWSRDAFPFSYRLAVVPAGIIPYLSRHPVLDLMGLTDWNIAHLGKLDMTEAPGHQRSSTSAVIDRRPEVVLGEALPFDHPPTQPEVLLATHRNVLKKLYRMPEFKEIYQYKTAHIGNRFTSYWILKSP